MSEWEAERWVNKVHLDTATPASDTTWRAEVVNMGLVLANRLLPQASTLVALPVQAILSLQSAATDVDPEIDFATGALHFYAIRSPSDDLSATIDNFAQPCLTLTEWQQRE
jgi:hypothetical protein